MNRIATIKTRPRVRSWEVSGSGGNSATEPARSQVHCTRVATSGLLNGKPRQATAIISTFSTVLAHSTPFPAPSCLGAQCYIVASFHRFYILRQCSFYHLIHLQHCNNSSVSSSVRISLAFIPEQVLDLGNVFVVFDRSDEQG